MSPHIKIPPHGGSNAAHPMFGFAPKDPADGWTNVLTRTIAIEIDNDVKARTMFCGMEGRKMDQLFVLGVDWMRTKTAGRM